MRSDLPNPDWRPKNPDFETVHLSTMSAERMIFALQVLNYLREFSEALYESDQERDGSEPDPYRNQGQLFGNEYFNPKSYIDIQSILRKFLSDEFYSGGSTEFIFHDGYEFDEFEIDDLDVVLKTLYEMPGNNLVSIENIVSGSDIPFGPAQRSLLDAIARGIVTYQDFPTKKAREWGGGIHKYPDGTKG